MGTNGCLICLYVLPIITWPIAIGFDYMIAYADAYPLSQTASHVFSNHTAYEAGKWILSILAAIGMSSWFKAGLKLNEIDPRNCIPACCIACSALVLGTLPFWLLIVLEVRYLNQAWDSGCDEWTIAAVLNASAVVGYNVSLGVATVALSSSNYSMQLVAFAPEMYSFSVINSFNYTPPIERIVYNNETHTFTADNSTTGNYTVAPQLTFPSLDLESSAPSYIRFQLEGGPASAWLSYNGTDGVLYTVNTSGQNATLFKVCGSLERAGDFQIALGAVFIQHQLDTLQAHGWNGLIWLAGD